MPDPASAAKTPRVSDAFREYRELFDYFGRGGMVRLSQREFEACRAELDALVAQARTLSAEQVARLVELRTMLFRERPKLAALLRR